MLSISCISTLTLAITVLLRGKGQENSPLLPGSRCLGIAATSQACANSQVVAQQSYTLGVSHPFILLGTSSSRGSGSDGVFYPKGIRSADYLGFYAEALSLGWGGFDFLRVSFGYTMSLLGPKLGPIVFQFPFFNRNIFRDRHEFLDRLVPFLTKLPKAHRFAIEIRDGNWLDAEFANLLRDHKIALVLQDRSFMPIREMLVRSHAINEKTLSAMPATFVRLNPMALARDHVVQGHARVRGAASW
jgi:hypothetical protein